MPAAAAPGRPRSGTPGPGPFSGWSARRRPRRRRCSCVRPASGRAGRRREARLWLARDRHSHSPHKKGQLARSQLALTAARRNDTLTGLGKRRIVIDRDRTHRKTKARQAFPSTDAAPRPARPPPASPSAAPSPPEHQPRQHPRKLKLAGPWTRTADPGTTSGPYLCATNTITIRDPPQPPPPTCPKPRNHSSTWHCGRPGPGSPENGVQGCPRAGLAKGQRTQHGGVDNIRGAEPPGTGVRGGTPEIFVNFLLRA